MKASNRAEVLVYNVLRNVKEAGKVYQGYVAPSTLDTGAPYSYISRISSTSLDQTLNEEGDKLRRVRLQIDVYDKAYASMVSRSEKIRDVLSRAFPSCIDDDTYGTVSTGKVTWNVTSIDIIIIETES